MVEKWTYRSMKENREPGNKPHTCQAMIEKTWDTWGMAWGRRSPNNMVHLPEAFPIFLNLHIETNKDLTWNRMQNQPDFTK